MKLFPLFLGIVCCTTTISCKKDGHTSSGTVYRGVVTDAICGNIVIQTVGPEHLGLESWIDSNRDTKPVLHHVFSVSNPCDLGGMNTNVRDTFNFVLAAPKVKDCIQCMAALPHMPDSRHSIELVK